MTVGIGFAIASIIMALISIGCALRSMQLSRQVQRELDALPRPRQEYETETGVEARSEEEPFYGFKR